MMRWGIDNQQKSRYGWCHVIRTQMQACQLCHQTKLCWDPTCELIIICKFKQSRQKDKWRSEETLTKTTKQTPRQTMPSFGCSTYPNTDVQVASSNQALLGLSLWADSNLQIQTIVTKRQTTFREILDENHKTYDQTNNAVVSVVVLTQIQHS